MARPLRIFISYRRNDSSGHSGRLYDSLISHLEGAELFLDVDVLQPGTDFDDAVRDAIESCDALLAVIGPRWLGATDSEGRRRLDKPGDLVRAEIAAALERGITVIPVLVDHAEPPGPDELPPSIAALSARQGVMLDDLHWGRGVQELVSALNRIDLADADAVDLGTARESAPARKRVALVHLELDLQVPSGGVIDPEVELAIATRARQELAAVAESFGGSLGSGDGQTVRMLFGARVAHEDDALRAAAAALRARSVLEELDWARTFSAAVGVRAGIGVEEGELLVHASGEAVVATGEAVRIAEAMAEGAGAGEILVGPLLQRLAGSALDLEAASEAEGPRRLLAMSDDAQLAGNRFDSPSVGRTHELAVVRMAFERASIEGSCQLITILGPAGIGKSRLRADVTEALAPTAPALVGQCLPYGDGITFWPVAEIVRQAAGIVEEDDTERALAKLAALVAGHEQEELIVEQVGAAIGLVEASASPEETFWAVRRLLEAASREGPRMIVFEDLHWAEPLLLDLVDHLAERWQGIGVLLICLARPELLESRPQWGGGKRNATALSLDPLSTADTRALIEGLLGAGQVPEPLLDRVAAAAEGNPLFVEQLIAMLVDREALVLEDGSWNLTESLAELDVPPSIQALLAARIDSLAPIERETTRSASIVGRVFYRGAVEALTPPRARAAVERELDALTRKQLIRPQGSTFAPEDTFGFVHILLRDAAYESLPKRSRADLHAAFADWLEDRAGAGHQYDEIIGHHLEAAYRYRAELGTLADADRELAARAAERLGSSGVQALSRGDVGAAASLLGRAVALRGPGRERARLGLDLTYALLDHGDLDAAAAALAEVSADAAGDEAQVARHAVASRFLDAYRGSLRAMPELFEEVERNREVFERTGDDEGAAEADELLGDLRMDAGSFGAAAGDLERALVHARRAGLGAEEAKILTWLASALFWGPAPAPDAIDRCERIRAEASRSPAAEAKVKLILSGLRAMTGDFSESRELFDESAEALEGLGLKVALATARQISGMAATLAGDLPRAEAELRIGYVSLREMEQLGFAVGGAAFLAHALVDQGKLDETEGLIGFIAEAAPVEDVVAQAHRELLAGRLGALRGEAPAALEPARAALASLDEIDDLRTRADLSVDLHRIASAAGVDDAAPLRAALDLYERKGVTPAAARIRALLAGRSGTDQA